MFLVKLRRQQNSDFLSALEGMEEKSSTGKAEVNQTLLNTDDYIFPSRERERERECEEV